MRKLKVVHSLKLMMFLVRNGFDVVKVVDAYPKVNEEKSKYKVFYFEETPELKETMFEFGK